MRSRHLRDAPAAGTLASLLTVATPDTVCKCGARFSRCDGCRLADGDTVLYRGYARWTERIGGKP
jgi:hypothetical protein